MSDIPNNFQNGSGCIPMLEKVARAIKEADIKVMARLRPDVPEDVIRRAAERDCGYPEIARAAIEAMRESTRSMWLPAWEILEGNARQGNLRAGSIAGGGIPAVVWDAMLDAILNEKETGA